MYDFYGSFWNTALRRKLYRKAKKHFNKVDRKRRGWVDVKGLIERLVRTKVKTLSNIEIKKLETNAVKGKIHFETFRDWYIRNSELLKSDLFDPNKHVEETQDRLKCGAKVYFANKKAVIKSVYEDTHQRLFEIEFSKGNSKNKLVDSGLCMRRDESTSEESSSGEFNLIKDPDAHVSDTPGKIYPEQPMGGMHSSHPSGEGEGEPIT
eukprot:UN24500